MKKIKNIRDCVLGVQGIGKVKPGEIVEMPDDIAASCLTAPASWQEVKEERSYKRKKPSTFAITKIDVTSTEDLDNGSN